MKARQTTLDEYIKDTSTESSINPQRRKEHKIMDKLGIKTRKSLRKRIKKMLKAERKGDA